MQSASLGYSGLTFPFNDDQPLPPVSRTATNVTESTPAKKITFFKSGDPQFSGVRMAIHKRSFKCFDALLDDLSHKVPLPFGVRTITTPHGTHCINTLEQLDDGGCYLCSDRRQVKPINVEAAGRKPAPWQSSHPADSSRRPSRPEELPGKQVSHRHPKRITLVKNSDPAVKKTIILNRLTPRSMKVFLEEISELLQCTVRRLYTLDGRKIDSIQALMQCASVVVCVGRETIRPFLAESFKKNSEEKLPGLGARSRTSICSESHESRKNVNFGLETKKSIIHPRSDSSNMSMRFSLSSEKSFPNISLRNSRCDSYGNTCPHAKEPIMDEDIEKRVLVNKDGSLSVEMKKEDEMGPIQQTNSEACSGVQAFCPYDTEDSDISKLHQSCCQNCCNHCLEYDIWKNPMHAAHSRQEDISAVRHITSSSSSASSHRRIIHKKSSMDSFHTTSSEEYTEHVVEQAMCYAETVEEGDARVEYCTISRCCSHGESCSTASRKAARPESRTSSVNSQCISCPSPLKNCETTAVTPVTDNEEKRPGSIASTSSKGSGNDTTSVQITEVPEDERPNSTSSNSSKVLEALKEEKDDNEDGKPPSSIFRASSQSENCKKVKSEPNDEDQSRSVASSSTTSCEKSPSPMYHLSSRPISKASSSSTRSNRSRKKKECVEYSDDDRCLSVVSSLPNCSIKEPTEEEEHQSAVSTVISSSKRSKAKRSSKVLLSESDRVTTPGSSVSETPAGHETDQAEEENDERPISTMSVNTKASGKSKKSNKFLCSRSERATTPGSSSIEGPAGQEMAQEAEDTSSRRPESNMSVSTKVSGKSKKSSKLLCSASEIATTPGSPASEGAACEEMKQDAENASSGRPVSNMSVSTRASGKSKKSNKMLCSGSERATTPGSSVSEVAACEAMAEVEVASSGRPVSNMSVSTRAGKSKKSNKMLCSGSERATTPGSSVSEVAACEAMAEVEVASSGRPVSNMSVSTRAGKSKKSSKLLCSGSEIATTPSSSVSVGAACEEMKEDAENASCGKPVSGMSVSTKASGKSKECKICQDDCSEKAPSDISSSSKDSAHMKKRTSSHVGDDVQPSSKASHFSLSSCEHRKESSSKLSTFQKSASNHTEPFVSETKEGVTVDPEEEDKRPLSNGSKSQSKESEHRKTKALSTSSSRPVSSLSSQSGTSKAKTNDLNVAEDDERPQSKISSVSSYLQVKCNGIKSTDPKTDDEGANSVMSKSTRSSRKGSKKQVKEEDSSRITAPLSVSSQSLHSPYPPKGKPSNKNVRTKILLGSSEGSVATESISAAELLRENAGNSQPATTESVSEKIECSRNNKGCKNKKSNSILKKKKDAKELLPSALPNATPTEVVHEWLRKIPGNTCIYELGDDFQEKCEEPVIKQHESQISAEPTLEVETMAKSAAKEVVPEEEELKKELEGNGEESEVKNAQDGDVEQCGEENTETVQATANESLSSTVPTYPNKEAFPNSRYTSVQVMKVLLHHSQGTKLDRCNSLPEVSATYGRKLSNSAKELLNCLASLQLIDEEPENSKAKESSAGYRELMNILQSLWVGDTSEDDQQMKLKKTFQDHQYIDDEFNHRSSSGVDVSSGSVGSGKSIITGRVDVIQSEKKAELPITQINVEGSVTSTRHEPLHRLLEENEISQDDQHSGHSTPRSKLNARWAEVFSNSTTPDIASRVQWSHGSEGIGSEEDKEQKNAGEEDTERDNKAEIIKEENEEPSKNEDESSSVKSPQETASDIQEKEMSISEKGASLAKRNSSDPDPVWVLNLLKKLEKQFMTHYMNAVSDFKVKWNLDSSEQLDIMINDLKEEVHTRIQTTIDRELKKIQGRAGRMPHPPGNTITRESTTRTEQRRLRLKVMNRRSVEGSTERSDDNYNFSGTEFSEQHSADEYCPCDTCTKKKIIARPAQPVVPTSVYIHKDFDLRQILHMKKDKPVEKEMGGNQESCTAETGDNGCAEEQEEMESADNEENQEVAEGGNQEENSEAGKEEGDAEETADNDDDEAQAEEDGDEADVEKQEVTEGESQEESSEAGNEGEAEETADNDDDEAQAEEEIDQADAEKQEVVDDENQEEIDGALEEQVVEEETVEEENEQRDKESSAEGKNDEVDVENQEELEEEETEVTDTKDNEEALAEEDEDAVDEENQDLENDVGGDEEAAAEANDEKHEEDKEDCEAEAENQETEEEIQEGAVENEQETEENEESQENDAQADEEGDDADAEDSDETDVQNDKNEETVDKDEEGEKEEQQEEEKEEEKVEVTDQAKPGEQADGHDEGNVALEEDNDETKENDQRHEEDETEATGEDNEIEDNPQNDNKECQKSEEAVEKKPSEVHKSSDENEDNSDEEEEENTNTEGNEISQDKETVVEKSLFNQLTKSSIEYQKGSMEKSIDKGIVRDNKNKNMQMYAESSSEEEERESGCDSPEGNQNNAASDSEKEEKTVTSGKNKSTNAEKPKEHDTDQDEFDF
ncbi:retinitis pigmentosa 1-like 1 protein isoform X2 [Acipenser ruthenus]|uniref:retinitis pigmentosa 1-like 1 protein isoform X2 n=1 Tax=Acipenser ruthenus TaxID=7906 RepID=UPI002740AFC2|nr:retinitis pigmentosa 1-like 1 protein isoform X2 [Acipenser ruthenus]